MATGFVSIHRELTNHWVWSAKPFSRGQAWVDMILRANHTEETIIFDGQPLEMQRGQFVSSETKLSEAWGWSRKKTSRFFVCLMSDQMLSYKRHMKGTIYTVLNYCDWQDIGTTKEPKKNRKRTAEEPLRNTVNNDNNISSKEDIKSEFKNDVLRLTKLLIDKIKSNNLAWIMPNETVIDSWNKTMFMMLTKDQRKASDVERIIIWCQADPFWKGNILSCNSLRKQFDRFLVQSVSKQSTIQKTDTVPKRNNFEQREYDDSFFAKINGLSKKTDSG